MKHIYVLGDSHVSLFSGKDEKVKVYDAGDDWIVGADHGDGAFLLTRIGPHTAYNLINHPEVKHNIESRVPKGSCLIISFGEVDCRNHLFKHQNIKQTVARYFEFLKSLESYKLAIFLPPPSGLEGIEDVDSSVFIRNLITREFIRECQIRAEATGIECLSCFDELIDEHLQTRLGEFYDNCHPKSTILPHLVTHINTLWKT